MTHADKSFAPLNSVIWCNYSGLWRFGSSTCPETRKKLSEFCLIPLFIWLPRMSHQSSVDTLSWFCPREHVVGKFQTLPTRFHPVKLRFFFLHERAAIDVTTGVVFQSSSAGCSCSPSVFIRARKRVCCIVTWCWLRARLRWLFWFLMKFIVSPLSSTSDCKVTPIWFAVSAH